MQLGPQTTFWQSMQLRQTSRFEIRFSKSFFTLFTRQLVGQYFACLSLLKSQAIRHVRLVFFSNKFLVTEYGLIQKVCPAQS